MPHIFSVGAAAIAWAVLFATPLRAQAPEPAVPAQPEAPKLDPKACADRDRLKQGDTVGSATPQENLTDKLARTDGVICPPPGLDPDIRAPAPRTRSDMPVIAPPANRGGTPQSPK